MKDVTPLDIVNVPLDGTSLIEASAGTGKTFAISQLYLRLLLEKELAPDTILVVTFTEAATKELRDRIRKNITCALSAADDLQSCRDDTLRAILEKYLSAKSPERVKTLLRKAVIGFDEAAVFTIHGFCKRMLSNNSFESSALFDTELITSQEDIVHEITDDFWRRSFSGSEALSGAIARKNGLDTAALVKLSAEIIRKPCIKLLPESIGSATPRTGALFDGLKKAWEASSAAIRNILLTDTGLKRDKNKYSQDNLELLFKSLDSALLDMPTAENLKTIAMFSAGELAKNLKKDKSPPEHSFFYLCDAFVQQEQREAMLFKADYVAYMKSELSRRKRARNVQSFDDLLLDLLGALQAKGGEALARAIRASFTAALIDEFQDTDPVQYEIFTTVFNVPGQSLFLIGDPKQSIYGFRGADIFSYISAASQIGRNRKYTLLTNWRSETKCVDGINHFFSKARNPFVLDDAIAYVKVQTAEQSEGNKNQLRLPGDSSSSIYLWVLKNGNPLLRGRSLSNKEHAVDAAVQTVVNEIARILNLASQGKAAIGGRPVRPSDFAILVMRNEDALRFIKPLSELNIPAVLAKTGSIFHTPEAEDMERLLRAVAAPGNARLLNAALVTAMIGLDAEQLCRLVEDERFIKDYEAHMENFSHYSELWNTRGFMRMFRAFLAGYEVRQTLLRLHDGERRLTNVFHLAELLHTASLEERLGPTGLIAFLSHQRAEDIAGDEHEFRLERDDEAVQILTVFKSKGLQYPIVFCPFMWQRGAAGKGGDVVFHRGGEVFLDIGSPDRERAHRAIAARENLSELMRLLYVGMTRAQNRCYLLCGKIGTPAATALDYLFTPGAEQGDLLVENLKNTSKSLSEEALMDAVNDYVRSAEGSLCVETPELSTPERYEPPRDVSGGIVSCRQFAGESTINRDWGIASYSMLAAHETRSRSGGEEQSIKRDEPRQNEDDRQEAAQTAAGFFAFPRGSVPGSCIHSIFESIDFAGYTSATGRPRIEQGLKNYGLAERQGKVDQGAAVHDMITKVLSAPLLPERPDFILAKITRQHRLSELGFFYPLKKITPQSLKALFIKHSAGAALLSRGFPEKIGGLEFRPIEGFMQGFIDLVFLHGGKYYLLDWKTNHLGNRYGDYAADRLPAVMEDSLYTLQYLFYSVALHKYLEQRLPGYRYEQYFGGILYLFVRGITPELPGNGIFYNLPAEEFVKDLCSLSIYDEK